MDMSRLQAFVAVVENGSFTKAAKALYVTQPSISVKIQELEGYYNTKLLDRNSNRVVPTEAGTLLYEQGKRILLLADNILKNIERLNNRDKTQIMVGASSTIGNFALPCSVYLFKEKYTDVEIILSINNTEQVINDITNHSIRIAIVEGHLDEEIKKNLISEKIKSSKIINHELVLAAPNNAEWEGCDEISLDDLKTIPLILREKGSGMRNTVEKSLGEKGISLNDLNVVLQLDSINAIISTVSANRGVAFLPKMAIRKELRYRTLKKITITDTKFPHPFTLLYLTDGLSEKYHKSFIDLLKSKDRGFC